MVDGKQTCLVSPLLISPQGGKSSSPEGGTRWVILIVFILLNSATFSQEKEKKQFKDIFSIDGYIKYMPSANFLKLNDMKFDRLIHNRINIKGYLSEALTLKIGIRNRVFFGNRVNTSQPFYGDLIGTDNGEIDLSFLPVNKNKIIASSLIDRAYLDWSKGKWEISAGRQRINWGVNLLWNTNDLFNAYNFIDFDYQERPGSDALRVQYFTGDFSSIDAAYKIGKDMDHSIIAGLFKFNKWKYDFQVLGANYNTDIALGGGWAGNIKDAGFKGEATLFQPKNNFKDTTSIVATSTSIDYSFKKGIYINFSFLYNSNGLNVVSNSQQGLLAGNLSAKNLMPSKYSYFAQVSGSFNPKTTGSFSTIYGQGINILFLMPAISYSVKQNWDTDVTGQIYFGEENEQFKNLGNAIFLRIKYSY